MSLVEVVPDKHSGQTDDTEQPIKDVEHCRPTSETKNIDQLVIDVEHCRPTSETQNDAEQQSFVYKTYLSPHILKVLYRQLSCFLPR